MFSHRQTTQTENIPTNLSNEIEHQVRRSRTLVMYAVLTLVSLMALVTGAGAQSAPPPVGRPILFVHGFCADANDWDVLRTNVISTTATAPNATGLYTDTTNYNLYYDPTADRVKLWPSGKDFLTNVTSSARFFSIEFMDPAFLQNPTKFDPSDVTDVSVLNKGNEVAQVIAAITTLTKVKDVIVVAHSMGGLDTRAYLENTAAPSLNICSDSDLYHSCLQTKTEYTQDIERLVTIDTPHGGAIAANYATVSNLPTCVLEDSLNRRELEETSFLIALLRVDTENLTPQLTIASIKSYLTTSAFANSDYIVTKDEQSFGTSLQTAPIPQSTFYDLENPFPLLPTSCGLPPLHFLSCLGQQPSTQNLVNGEISKSLANPAQTTSITVLATLDGNPWPAAGATGNLSYEVSGPTDLDASTVPSTFYGIPVGDYALSYMGGGPSSSVQISPTTQFLGVDHTTGANTWNITFTLAFTSIQPLSPAATTTSATGLAGDGATLNGTVNPNGFPTFAWFEWSTSSSLVSFTAMPQQAIGSGTTAQPVSADLSGLASNTTYFYRMVASNAAGTSRSPVIAAFTTLGTLPKPILQSPANGATGVSTAPAFTWSTVPNATSYRLMIATTPGALPLDATSATCNAGCLLNATPTSNSFQMPAGTLSQGMTYYWEVHGRSPSQFGDWSAISSFSVSAPAVNDFSLQTSPSSQTVTVSGSAGYSISTVTTAGSPQTITLSAANLPAGVSAIFTPNILTSGQNAVLGVTTSLTTPPGSYNLTVLASGSSITHTTNLPLVVNGNTGAAAVTFSPTSLAFSEQTLFTNSPSQLVNFINTGNAPLQVMSIVGDNNFAVVSPCINTLPPGTRCTFSVVFDPSVVGPVDGKVQLFFVGATSPAVLTLHGTGVAPAPTTGIIQVSGTLNGSPLPNSQQFSYPFSYSLSGPDALTGGGAATFTVDPGTYTISFTGSPSTFTLASVTQGATQTVSAGSVTMFTLNFTAPNDFSAPFFFLPFSQVVKAGTSATFTAGVGNPPPGNAATPITLQVTGTPAGANASFSPTQAGVGPEPVLTVSTDSTLTPAGAYTLSLTGTNSSGLVHPGSGTASLVVTNAPATPVQLISQSTSGAQANGASRYSTNNAASADGRFIVFVSSATNLAANANGFNQIYVRDRQAGTTSLVSVNNAGVIANNDALTPTISADGRFVAFASGANNLPQAPTDGSNAIYIRDLQLGQTERADVSGGVGSNGVALLPTISADGRFVAFGSNATNLAPAATSGSVQVFIRDRIAAVTSLVSLGIDGLQASGSAFAPTLSADGRYVAFLSNSSNLVATPTGGRTQVYLRDMQADATTLVSIGADGTAANGTIFGNGASPGLSADGRLVAFTSNATNLVPGAIDANGDSRVFARDVVRQVTQLVDIDAAGTPLTQGGFDPTISADGRFVTYQIYSQTLVRDMTTNQSVAVSLAPDGSPQNSGIDQQNPPSISYNGSTVVFGSNATNLVAGDSNGASDVFSALNPFMGNPFATSIGLDASSINGGAAVSGTITLSGPAPANGATVSFSSNNPVASLPAVLFVPPGASSARFTIASSIVPKETVLTILASYNGGAATAVLAVQPAPNLVVSPTSWDFGPQLVHNASAANSFTITNSGTLPVNLNSVSLATGQVFSISTNTCGASLAAGSSCSVSVVFTPSSAGEVSDFLQISFGSPAANASVQLLGTGGEPTATLSSLTIDFGAQQIPSTTQKTLTVTNLGNAALSGMLATIAGLNAADFSIVNDGCSGTTLPVNNSCLITISFAPGAAGARTATVSLSSNAPGSPSTVTLTGIGAAPGISLSSSAITFSNQPVATSSAPQVVTVQNTGTAPLPIASIALSGVNAGDFSQTNTCGTNLAAGASCAANIIFTPASLGTRSATLLLTDSLGTQSVALSGTGTAALAALSPASLTFPNQPVGAASALQVITLANAGNLALSVTSISVAGTNSSDFSATNTCGASVAAGTTCSISISFTPGAPGSRSAVLNVVDSVGTQTVTLSGTGTAPAVSLSSSSLTFAPQAIGSNSAAQTVTLTNSGNGTLTISSITVTGANAADFLQNNTCGSSIAPGAACAISVTFKPTVAGARSGAVSIADNAGAQSIALSGTGLISGPAVQFTPTSLSFGIQAVNTTSPIRTISVVNTGSVALSITSISVTGANRTNFTETNTCGTTVAIGASCTISVTFTPSAAGQRSAAITVKDGAGTQTVALSGTEQAALTVSPASISFGNQPLGSTGTAHTVTITNNTGLAVDFTSITVTGANTADFVQLSSTCGASLAFQASCTINLAFAPAASGARAATLTIVDDATNSPQSVTLSGTGALPVTLSPSSLTFTAKVGATSASKNVTIKNVLATTLTISSVTIGGTNAGDFKQTATTCGATLGAGASCTVSIAFAPTATGTRTGMLTVNDSAVTSPQSIALSGTGN